MAALTQLQDEGAAAAAPGGSGLAPPPAPLLFPRLTVLSIVGAGNLASVDLGGCPNLERLKLCCCGSLARIQLGGAGRRLTTLEIGGLRLDETEFRRLADGLSRAGPPGVPPGRAVA